MALRDCSEEVREEPRDTGVSEKKKKTNPGSQNIKILLLFKGKPGDFLGGSAINNLPVKQELQETQVQFLGLEDPREEGMAAHSDILAWKIPCTEEPGVLQSIGSQRVRHD